MIRCTANTVHVKAPNRCVRQIGHAGLHRVFIEGKVNEFDSTNAVFPKTAFTEEELEAIARGEL